MPSRAECTWRPLSRTRRGTRRGSRSATQRRRCHQQPLASRQSDHRCSPSRGAGRTRRLGRSLRRRRTGDDPLRPRKRCRSRRSARRRWYHLGRTSAQNPRDQPSTRGEVSRPSMVPASQGASLRSRGTLERRRRSRQPPAPVRGCPSECVASAPFEHGGEAIGQRRAPAWMHGPLPAREHRGSHSSSPSSIRFKENRAWETRLRTVDCLTPRSSAAVS
jgi:hypothetical protein